MKITLFCLQCIHTTVLSYSSVVVYMIIICTTMCVRCYINQCIAIHFYAKHGMCRDILNTFKNRDQKNIVIHNKPCVWAWIPLYVCPPMSIQYRGVCIYIFTWIIIYIITSVVYSIWLHKHKYHALYVITSI